jgi:copper chaperone CopZ
MYGDHHVTEVRRLLLEIPGVDNVYASSSFQIVEVKYDGTKLEPEVIINKLEKNGYLGELAIAVERGALEQSKNGNKPFFRQTAAYEQTGLSLGFEQRTPFAGRPLWPCPGMGPIESLDLKTQSEEEQRYG